MEDENAFHNNFLQEIGKNRDSERILDTTKEENMALTVAKQIEEEIEHLTAKKNDEAMMHPPPQPQPPASLKVNDDDPLPFTIEDLSQEQDVKLMADLEEEISKIPKTQKVNVMKKYRYTLGKQNRRVGVLVNKTRRDAPDLKLLPIEEVKLDLKKRGLLRDGSLATHNCIRTIFEASKLTGDVQNANSEIKIENFLAGAI